MTTPGTPYYAVIFTSELTERNAGYTQAAQAMEALAAQQPGYLGFESRREAQSGIAISYWSSEEALLNWKNNAQHQLAQQQGQRQWYRRYRVEVAKVERVYEHQQADETP